MKKLLQKMPLLPEILLLILSSSWIIDLFMGVDLNYPMILMSVIITVVLLLKNKVLSTIFAFFAIVISLLILEAAISEFTDFPTINLDAILLLTIGSLIAGIIAFMSFLILYKFHQSKAYK